VAPAILQAIHPGLCGLQALDFAKLASTEVVEIR
jgi:hypothetical protein